MSSTNNKPIIITAEDLPLHCPGSNAPQWSMHPRVFLDITDTGTVTCPYCSATYQLKEGEKGHGH